MAQRKSPHPEEATKGPSRRIARQPIPRHREYYSAISISNPRTGQPWDKPAMTGAEN